MIKPLPALLAVHLSILNYCFAAAPGFSCPSWHVFTAISFSHHLTYLWRLSSNVICFLFSLSELCLLAFTPLCIRDTLCHFSFVPKVLYYVFHMCISYFVQRQELSFNLCFYFQPVGKSLHDQLVTIGILVCALNRIVWTTEEILHFNHNVAITNSWRIWPCEIF